MIKNNLYFNGRILNYVRVVDMDRQLEAMPIKWGWVVKAGYMVLRGFNRVRNSLGPRVGRGRVSVVEDTGFGVEADALWDRVSPFYGFMLKRDSGYLNWRYCDPRLGGYEIRKAYEGDVLLGYCVFKANRFREEYPVGYVMDLVAVPGRLDVACSLVGEAVRCFDDAGVNVVNVMAMEGAFFLDALRLNGFLDSRMRVNVFLDPFGEIRPCNGMDDASPANSMGNLNERTFEEIWNGEKGRRVRAKAFACAKNCWMIGTASPAMKKNLLPPAAWVARNMLRTFFTARRSGE